MNILVGYTGFVGSNLVAQHKFDGLFNSSNISANVPNYHFETKHAVLFNGKNGYMKE